MNQFDFIIMLGFIGSFLIGVSIGGLIVIHVIKWHSNRK